MLSKAELSRFGSGMLTDVFIDRPSFCYRPGFGSGFVLGRRVQTQEPASI